MQLTKTLMLAALAASVCSPIVALRAQTTNVPAMAVPATNAPAQFHPPIHSQLDFIAMRCSFTEEEKAKAKPIFDELFQKMNALPMAERRAKSVEIREAALAKLKDVVAPEHYDKCRLLLMGPRAAHPSGAFVPPAPMAATNSVKTQP